MYKLTGKYICKDNYHVLSFIHESSPHTCTKCYRVQSAGMKPIIISVHSITTGVWTACAWISHSSVIGATWWESALCHVQCKTGYPARCTATCILFSEAALHYKVLNESSLSKKAVLLSHCRSWCRYTLLVMAWGIFHMTWFV